MMSTLLCWCSSYVYINFRNQWLSTYPLYHVFFFVFFKSVVHICHDEVIKWKHFPRHWPFVRGIHRSPVNSPHKGQCRGALVFSLICVWKGGWVNNRETGDFRRHRTHYDVIVMTYIYCTHLYSSGNIGVKTDTIVHLKLRNDPFGVGFY